MPGFDRTLKGVTAVRAMELAPVLIGKGLITPDELTAKIDEVRARIGKNT